MLEKKIPEITDSEWLIMKAIWNKNPITASEIISAVLDEAGTTTRTIKSLLHRLTAKKAVGYTIDENNPRKYHYFPLVTKEECIKKESAAFVNLIYENKPEKMLTDFLRDTELNKEDILLLEQILKSKKEGVE